MTSKSSYTSADYIERVRALLQHMEAGEEEQAEHLIDEITRLRESTLFQELGKLTREFHEALNSFRMDSRLATLAEQEFPDARERLKYVIKMTAESADRTLGAVEESVPLCEGLETQAAELQGLWERFVRKEMDAGEFRQMSRQLSDYLERTVADSGRLKANLNEVLMAQDFQDLTGQIIQRVITLVDEMEGNLVELIRISGQHLRAEEGKEKEVDALAATGPAVPGVDTETVGGQDDVDELLSSLGF